MSIKSKFRSFLCRRRDHHGQQLSVIEQMSPPMYLEFGSRPGSMLPPFGTRTVLARYHCSHCGTTGVGPVTTMMSIESVRELIDRQNNESGDMYE